jgi:hypothetical protein
MLARSLAILWARLRWASNLAPCDDGHSVALDVTARQARFSSLCPDSVSFRWVSELESVAPRVSAALNQLAWVLRRAGCFADLSGAALVRPNVRVNRPAEAGAVRPG